MVRRLLVALAVSQAYVLDLVLDGAPASLRFEASDDLRRVAAEWSARYPEAGGMDCDDGDAGCIVDLLVDAMRGVSEDADRVAGAVVDVAERGVADCGGVRADEAAAAAVARDGVDEDLDAALRALRRGANSSGDPA